MYPFVRLSAGSNTGRAERLLLAVWDPRACQPPAARVSAPQAKPQTAPEVMVDAGYNGHHVLREMLGRFLVCVT